MKDARIIVVGAGHAGVQVASSLREQGHIGPLVLISDEPDLPYHRPPLSKAFLKMGGPGIAMPIRSPRFFSGKDINLVLGHTAMSIDRARRTLHLDSIPSLTYDHLVLATGSRERQLNQPGTALRGVHQMRTLDDARKLRSGLRKAGRLVIIGAGFIGLEIAATATEMGLEVAIVELTDRPLARSVSPGTSAFYKAAHASFGASMHFEIGATAFIGEHGQLKAVELSNGTSLPADIALLGIGVEPNDKLARAAGLRCDRGIIVDDSLQTSDPAISALGDVASVLYETIASAPIQSVQNATDQARFLAARLMGHGGKFRAVPWFWSEQRDLTLQIVGLSAGCTDWIATGDPQSRLSAGFKGNRLAAVETVNRSKNHVQARRLFDAGIAISMSDLSRDCQDLERILNCAG